MLSSVPPICIRYLAICLVYVAGCDTNKNALSPGAASAGSMKSTISAEESGVNRIELAEPVVRFEPPNIIRFDVQYDFAEGRPNRYYLCEIVFPGTMHFGKKYMEKWELQKKGSIKSGIELPDIEPMVTDFEIKMSEANSPDAGYKPISNVVSGKVILP